MTAEDVAPIDLPNAPDRPNAPDVVDASAPIDARPNPDVAAPPDAQSQPDATTPDAVTPPDVAPTPDVATTPDVAAPDVPRLDVVTTPDVTTPDVSTPPDASTPDVVPPDTGSCSPETTRCAGACVDTRSSLSHCGGCGVACAPLAGGEARCVASACRRRCLGGFALREGACVAVAWSRPIAPLSASRVSSQRPTLRWALHAGATAARVTLCRDRACTSVIETIDATGTSARPTVALAPGAVYWRVQDPPGSSAPASPTWEFFVGPRSASADTAQRAVLDVNGDGFGDLAVGHSLDAFGENPSRVLLYRGSATGIANTPTSALLPSAPLASFGSRLSSAGDVNGDGFGDLIVGAEYFESGRGAAYVYLGGAAGLSATPASTFLGDGGAYCEFGGGVAGVGDLNGDGYGDVVVGAWGAGEFFSNASGNARVYLGGEGGLNSAPVAVLTPVEPGFADQFGHALVGLGDVNGDGFADMAISRMSSATTHERVHIYLGSPAGVRAEAPQRLVPFSEGASPFSNVLAAGDLNGDGYADLAVGVSAPMLPGRVFVFYGGAASFHAAPDLTMESPDGANANFGQSVQSADVNGDGFDDLLVSAPGAATNAGRVYLYAGSASGLSTTALTPWTGTARNNAFGSALAAGADLDGDGLADFSLGEPDPAVSPGRVHVYLPRRSGLPVAPATVLTSGATSPTIPFGTALAM